jgi:hypothetical protein
MIATPAPTGSVDVRQCFFDWMKMIP